MNSFQLYSINHKRLWKVNPGNGACVSFGPKDKEYVGKLYFIAGSLYSNNGDDLYEIDRTSGESKLIKRGGWKKVTSMVACKNIIYAINDNQLVTVAISRGEMTSLGNDAWSKDAQLACVDDQLFAVAAGVFYRIQSDGNRSIISDKWAANAKIAVLGSTLFALDRNQLWRWSDEQRWQQLGNEHWQDSGFLISAGSFLFGVDKGSFWRVNTYTGQSCKLGDGNWSDCASCVTEPLGIHSIASPYDANGNHWIKGEQHTHVNGMNGRAAQGPNGTINNYDILRNLFDQGDYDFVVATGHESFPEKKETLWSIAKKNEAYNSIPACVTDDNGSRYMLVIAGMERQHNASMDYDNVSLVVSKKLQAANVHTRYIEKEGNPACCLHPCYFGTQYIPPSKGELSELELLICRQDLTKTGTLIMDSLEVFNDFGIFQDQFSHAPEDKEQLRKGEGRGFAEHFWDQVLLSGRNIWGHAGDCSYYNRSEKGAQGIQGRVGAGWIMVQIGSQYDPSDYVGNKDKIIKALERGKFYATTGVLFTSISVSGKSITITANKKLNWRSMIGPNIYYQPMHDVSKYVVTFPTGAKYLRIECTDISDQKRFDGFGCYPKAWTQAFWPKLN